MSSRIPQSTVLVLGGAGFIGRHTVAALLELGHRVVIGTRHPKRRDRRLGGAVARCERRAAHLERLLDPDAWNAVLAGVDVVINSVGILRPWGRATYERVHHLAPVALAEACRRRRLRLVHVSALGLHQGRSRFLRSKRRGEKAVLASAADAVLVRPSLLYGDGGFGARWLRRVAHWPVHPFPANATGRLAALDVDDLGLCLARLAMAPTGTFAPGRHRIIELGGPVHGTIADLLSALRQRPGAAVAVPIPGVIVRLVAHICDLLHATPLSFGHYELLQHDNVPATDDCRQLLGRRPRTVGVWPPLHPCRFGSSKLTS